MQLAVEKGVGAFDELIDLGKSSGVSFDTLSAAVQTGGKELKSVAGEMGLTSNQLKKMYNEADKSATVLQNFSDVAGLTNIEFAQLFKENPAEAIMQFVEGLSHAEERGTSAIKVLDDMDITEVRLRDSLLRAANASSVFGDAIETGNAAFEENTALAEEANKRYETVESQLGMLKNEVVDVAIEFGGPFLQALRDGVQSAKPLITTIAELAKKFSEANPETQQAIMKFLGLAAAIGPVSKVLGGFLKITGDGMTTVGKFNQWIGKLSGTAKANKSEMDFLAKSTGIATDAMTQGSGKVGLFAKTITGAKTSVFGFSGVMGALTSPIGLAVGALAAGAVVWKVWGEDAYNSAQRTKRWGADVSETTADTLTDVQRFSDDSQVAMLGFEKGVAGSAEGVKASFESMAETIKTTAEEATDAMKETIEQLPEHLKESAEKNAKQVEEQNNKIVKASETMSKQVADIYERHNNNVSEFTAEEKEIVLHNRQAMMQAELNLLEISGKDKSNVMAAMNNDLSKMNETQLSEYAGSLASALSAQQKSYEDQINSIKTARKQGLLNESDYNSEMEKLQSSNVAMTQTLGEKFIEAYRVMGKGTEETKVAMRQFGLDYDDIIANMVVKSSEGAEANTALAKSAKDMSQDTILANQQWNSMIFDPKTGELKTNVSEILSEAITNKDKWENMEFILKNANLDTNARQIIAIALGETGKWDKMTPDQKNLITNNDVAMRETIEAINKTKDWNGYKALVKELGANNTDAIKKITSSKETLEAWNKMSPTLKNILVNNKDKSKITESKSLMNEWNRLPSQLKKITIRSDTSGAWEAKRAIDNVNDKNVTIRVNYQGKNTGQTAIRATGDPYFQGGPVWLGDGGKAEPFLTPQGNFGISPADWTMFDLPRGTKIWPSIQKMMDSIPRYAQGTKFDDTALSRLPNLANDTLNGTSINNQTKIDLKEVIKLLRVIASKNFGISKDAIGQAADDYAGRNLNKLLYGGGV